MMLGAKRAVLVSRRNCLILAAIIRALRSKPLQVQEILREQALVGTGLPCLPCLRVPFDRKTPIMVEAGLNPTTIGVYGGGKTST